MLLEFGIGAAFFCANESLKLDEKAMQKNAKAFNNMAVAQYEAEMHQKQLMEKLEINAKRKNGILNNHIKMFMEQYHIFQKVQFERGRGIEELEMLERIQTQLTQYVASPQIASGSVMNDKQLLINFALLGIGGVIIKESKANLKAASQNLSRSRVVEAQANTISIAADALSEKVQIITDLLQKLGAVYMLSIRELQRIVEQNGTDAHKYSQDDVNAINTSVRMTKLIYRIINTPLIDKDGKIEQEALLVINEGQQYLNQLQSL